VQSPSVITGCLHDGPLCGGRGAADLAHCHPAERQHEAVLMFARQRLPNWMGPSFAHRVIQASARLRIVPGSQVAGVRRFASTYQRCLQWDIEQAFKELKHDLAIRPIYHQTDERIEAHILLAFLKQRPRSLAPGLAPRSVLDKMAAIQIVDVHLPTTDGRTVILSRYTEPEPDQVLLLQQLKVRLPDQPPPRIASGGVPLTK
jgi:hypothetical protein